MMTNGLEELVWRYLDDLRTRNLQPTTIRDIETVLRRVTRWFNRPLLYIDSVELHRWQAARSRDLAPTSLRSEMSLLGGFYRWAVRRRYLPADPMFDLDMPKVRPGLPRPIDEAKVAALLKCDDIQVVVILALAGFAGLRACEIAILDWRDIDLQHRTIHVIRKGGREQVLGISPALLRYLDALTGPRRGPVIARRDGRGGNVRPWRISSLANTYIHECGWDDTLHTLRHRFATVLLDLTGDIAVVAEAMGHASTATTAIYAKVRARKVRDAMDLAGQVQEETPEPSIGRKDDVADSPTDDA